MTLLAKTVASVIEAKICVSSAYKQGVENCKQLGKSFIQMRNIRGPRIDPEELHRLRFFDKINVYLRNVVVFAQ